MNTPQLILASASPRRRELLAQLGLRFDVAVADIDETPRTGEVAELYVVRMALEKARAVRRRLGDLPTSLPVLGSDTSVVVDGEILGKPRDRADGLAMLARLAGRSHQVYTSVALVMGGAPQEASRLCVSNVTFGNLSEAERMAYWATGEPLNKAGGYAIQGRAGAFISHLEGSFSGVMGLPLFETTELLRLFGVEVCQNWSQERQ